MIHFKAGFTFNLICFKTGSESARFNINLKFYKGFINWKECGGGGDKMGWDGLGGCI